jgi:hypothetical protein
MKTIIAIVAALAAGPALAQQCGPRVDVVQKLRDNFGEVQQSYGVAGNAVIETFANPETGSWTVLRSVSTGRSCIMAAGDRFELVLEPAGEEL